MSGALAIIPARGGSKRIPKKNTKEFAGRPMIAWPIAAAKSSRLFDQIVVSTDDPHTAELAKQHGATVPFTRPAELSGDHVALRPVINHAIKESQQLFGRTFEHTCILLGTAAFVTPGHLQEAYELLLKSHGEFALPTIRTDSRIFRAFSINNDSGLEMLFPQHRLTRSQDLPAVFVDAGQFYWGKSTAFLEDKPMFGPNSRGLEVGPQDMVDIDTEEDWQNAEAIFSRKLASGTKY
jgi:pseudaminic acid cytidylyltransferase